jgi:hypothetical protein
MGIVVSISILPSPPPSVAALGLVDERLADILSILLPIRAVPLRQRPIMKACAVCAQI